MKSKKETLSVVISRNPLLEDRQAAYVEKYAVCYKITKEEALTHKLVQEVLKEYSLER